MSEFMDVVKEEAKRRLYDRIGETVYLCDLGMELTEAENCDGTWSYSRRNDMTNIKIYWDECADFVEYYHSNLGEDVPNVFENPEKFFCCMMIEAISSLVGQSICDGSLSDKWNDEVELTEEMVKTIVEDFDNIDEVF